MTKKPAAADEKGEGKENEPSAKQHSKLDELGVVGTILAAVGGGLGVLGFVAFFGAAILWIRMTEAGLPGNDAVAVVPNSVLVATGASFLVPALLIALAFTVLLYLIDAGIQWHREKGLRKLEARIDAAKTTQKVAQDRVASLDRMIKTAREHQAATQSSVEKGAFPAETGSWANAELLSRLEDMNEARRDESTAATALLERTQELPETERHQREGIEQFRKWLLIGSTVALFAVGTIWMLHEYSVHLQPGRIFVLVLAAALLTTFCVVVRLRTDNFGWFALASFVAVGLMIGTLTYYRTRDDPKVEPAAVVRAKGPPVFGFFVTQTSDRVYLGTGEPGGAAQLDAIPRDEVIGLLIGKLQSPTEVPALSLALAQQLCERARLREATGEVVGEKGGGRVGEERASGCTAADLRQLEADSPLD